ncbi:MAG: C39 family peptidase [Rariglobus sp.]|nr:C39 family peptidase [Rariglobus sp.]
MPRLPHAALALLFAFTPLHARTWTDSQGRTLEADYVSATATDVTLRRAADNRTFVLPLATLTAADRNVVSAQLAASSAAKPSAPPARDFAELNTLLGLPLLADDTLWDDEPAAVAKRLRLPIEGKTDRFEGYRAYARTPVPLMGADANMLSLQAAEGRITTLTIQFTNRGDYAAFQDRERFFSPSKADLKAFDEALKRDFDALSTALTVKLGEPKREIAVGGLDAGRRSLRWEWGAHALLVSQDAGQMVSLKIIPAEKSATARLGDDQVRRMFKERITRRANGDVILDQIPMVNQGPKGYCVPATFERYLRYAGIPADMYELAATGGTDFGGGSSFETMTASLDRFVRRQGRRLEKAPLKLTVQGIARYIDEGRPIIWGLYSTEAYNALANANTLARRTITDGAPWKPVLTPAELAEIHPESETSHACLIVGYNRVSNEIAVSDSWGPKFQERWVPAPAALKASQDEYWVLAW